MNWVGVGVLLPKAVLCVRQARMSRLLIVGEYDEAFLPHRATDAALSHVAASSASKSIRLGFDSRIRRAARRVLLQEAAAVLVAPGSPYRSLAGD